MSDRLQRKRDGIEVGDEVYVVRTSGSRTQRKLAKVLDTNRAAARVRYVADGEETMVQLKYLERIERAPKSSKPAELVIDEPDPAYVPKPPQVLPPPSVTIKSDGPTEPVDDVDAWLAMGRDLVPSMRAKIGVLENQERALRKTANEALAGADELAPEARRIAAQARSYPGDAAVSDPRTPEEVLRRALSSEAVALARESAITHINESRRTLSAYKDSTAVEADMAIGIAHTTIRINETILAALDRLPKLERVATVARGSLPASARDRYEMIEALRAIDEVNHG